MVPGGPRVTLFNGVKMPWLGLGTAASDGGVSQNLEAALRIGIRHIDTAQMYQNHTDIGKTLAKMTAPGGEINRSEVHITSKLDNSNHAPERVAQSCRESLKELQLEYLDLFLMHWPVTEHKGPTLEPPIKDTWQAMEKLVDEGLVCAIGVSNFSIKKLTDLLTYARIPPAVNEIEVHPFMRNQANIDFCKSKDIVVTTYSPLGSPDDAALSENKRGNMPLLMDNEVVQGIAKKHSKHPAEVLVRWGLQHGTAVIPRASSESHLRSNLGALDWELPQEDFEALSSFKFQARMQDGHMWLSPEGPYKTMDELWDGEVLDENRVD